MPKAWRIAFWTPAAQPPGGDDVLGCSSHGLLTGEGKWISPEEPACVFWNELLEGELLVGSFDTILRQTFTLSWRPDALLVLLAHGGEDAEAFLRGLASVLPGVPMAGGAAARPAGRDSGELLPKTGDAIVLAVRGGGMAMSSVSLHERIGDGCGFRKAAARTIGAFSFPSGLYAPEMGYRLARAAHGIPDEDFESFTFSDSAGRNLHFSVGDGIVSTGANLPDDGVLYPMLIPCGEAGKRFSSLCGKPGSLIFGCAGLHKMLSPAAKVGKDSIAAFLFGEVVTLSGTPSFANLMVSMLSRTNSKSQGEASR